MMKANLQLKTLNIEHDKLTTAETDRLVAILKTQPKPIGEGVTSKVYALSDTKICRIQAKPAYECYDYKQSIRSTLKWQRACLSLKNQHCPKIYFLATSKNMIFSISRTPSCIVTVMERLVPLKSAVPINSDCKAFLCDIQDATTFGEPIDDSSPFISKYKNVVSRDSLNALIFYMYNLKIQFNDCHPGNVMIRAATGKLVITDPVV